MIRTAKQKILSAFASGFLLALTVPQAHAMPTEGGVSRFGFELNSWQEPLLLQDLSGNTDNNVASYKGFSLSYERQLRTPSGGYGLMTSIGSGQASGGSSAYAQGTTSWVEFSVEPRLIWTFNEQIDAGVGVAGFYRSASWPDTSNFHVTSAQPLSGVFYLELDISLTSHFGFQQALGLESVSAGPFFRWGLTYDL